ncbi:hypothetical protein ACIP01_07720 [Pseudomonas monteilii]|uniref:hypothetical protein n=1 Tax=Pseudomonas monteilii TaxID=76759 RepID=UPI003820D582
MDSLGKRNLQTNFAAIYQLDKGSGHINACLKTALSENGVDIIYCEPRNPYHKQYVEKFFEAWTTSKSQCTPDTLSEQDPQ